MNSVYFCPQTIAFYLPQNAPDGAIEITQDSHKQLIQGRAKGLEIVPDANGCPVLADPAQSITIAQLVQRLRKATAAMRWKAETGGIRVGGTRIATGIEDQNRITTVIANAQMAGVHVLDFKTAEGWVTLTLEQLQGIASAIARHVQACFTAERKHDEAITAIAAHADPSYARAQLLAYDTAAHWPEPNMDAATGSS